MMDILVPQVGLQAAGVVPFIGERITATTAFACRYKNKLCVNLRTFHQSRVAAGAFGFLIFSHALDGPDLYGASA
jgi:hypothetical protein